MLTLEDLFVANQAARQRLVEAEPLRQVLLELQAPPERVQLVRVLHERLGVPLEQAKGLHTTAQRYMRQRSEERYLALAKRDAVAEPAQLDALAQEQVAAGYAWTLGERLVREQRIPLERHQALSQQVQQALAEEEAATLHKSQGDQYSSILGPPRTTPSRPNRPPSGLVPTLGFSGEDARAALATPASPTPAADPLPILDRATIRMTPGEVLAIPGQPPPAQAPGPGGEVTLQLDPTQIADQLRSPEPAPLAPAPAAPDPQATITLGAGAAAAALGGGELSGQVLGGKYQVIRELGRGAMGLVYLAQAPGHAEPVAVKVVQGPATDEVRGRFRREILVSQRIKHPNVIAVFDAGELPDGSSYMVMEALEGEDLSAVIRRDGAQPIERSLALLEQTLQGLNAVHQNRIVHRDLKPENLQLVQREGQDHVKIMDFGISRFLDDDPGINEKLFVTMKGQLSGTPQYVAPEAVLDPEMIKTGHDVYACGVILYELLTGVLPFPPARTLRDMLQDTVHSRARPLDEANPEGAPYPQPLERFVRRLLEKDEELRPQDAGGVLELLAEARDELAGKVKARGGGGGAGGERREGFTARLIRSITSIFRRKPVEGE